MKIDPRAARPAALAALWALTLALPAAASAYELPEPDWSAAPAGPHLSLVPLRLAQADDGGTGDSDGAEALRMHAGPEDEEPWRAPWITGSKVHQYLGIGSLLAAGLAAVSAPESEDGGTEDEKGFHHYAGWTAAALGGAAVGTGLVYHWDDFRLKDGFLDPDNLHALLGVLATAAYFAAVTSAPDTDHAALGVIGGGAMLISIKIAW